jgi:hypothetical protein
MKRAASSFLGVAAIVGLAGCNSITGVNDFSTPTCEECQRRECAAEFTKCKADRACAELTTCLAGCPAHDPTCADRCQNPPGIPNPPGIDAGGPPPGGPDPTPAAALISCGQTHCTACAL